MASNHAAMDDILMLDVDSCIHGCFRNIRLGVCSKRYNFGFQVFELCVDSVVINTVGSNKIEHPKKTKKTKKQKKNMVNKILKYFQTNKTNMQVKRTYKDLTNMRENIDGIF